MNVSCHLHAEEEVIREGLGSGASNLRMQMTLFHMITDDSRFRIHSQVRGATVSEANMAWCP